MAEKKAIGRPTIKTPELADAIFARMAEGESLRSICKSDGMPELGTVMRWRNHDADFREHYTRAMQARAEFYAEEIIDNADNAAQVVLVEGVPLVVDGKPVTVVDVASVNHARLKVDARKWVASKLLPKVYGDNAKLELTGADNGPVQVEHKGAAIADILAKAAERKARESDDLEGLV